MELGKLNFVQRDGSIFAGAIFMSNRETKLECLQKKLFGLPLSMSRFLKQVKAGMILFLFEHEERKLYGVFEATSDGALNIIPDAFRSTGKSYPAQILFKRIWMCKPLCEDEFRSAIGENYYSPNKFYFGLSYGQVIKLIHLFYSRKINIKQYKRHRIPNEIFEQFENTAADEAGLTETETYFKYKSDEYSSEGKREVGRQFALPQASLEIPMQHKRHATTTSMQHTVANSQRGSNQVNLCLFEGQLPYSRHSYSETINSQRSSICLPHDHIAFHHFVKQPSSTSEMDYKPLHLQSCHTSNLNNMDPYLMDVHHHSNTETVACKLPCNNHNMIPRMIKIQEEDRFTSSHAVSDVSAQTEVVQHTCVSGAQPNQFFEFPDYIPLIEESQQKLVNKNHHNSSLENSEYIPFATLNSCIPSTCKEISKSFYSADGKSDNDEARTYQRMEDDEYEVSSQLHADSGFRNSVFSRLSRDQKVCNHETPEPSSSEPSRRLSLDQLLNILSERRNSWSTKKVSKQSMEWGSNEQYDCAASTGLFNQKSRHHNRITKLLVQPMERSKIDQCEGIAETEHDGFTATLESDQSNDVVTEESFELPFYNFRRRNTSQKFEVQDDSNKYSDISGSETTLVKSKRRRIVRPSLYGEMHQNVKGEAEVKTSAQTILEHKNERLANVGDSFLHSDVLGLQTGRKYELEGVSVEQNHATSIDGSVDHIPTENTSAAAIKSCLSGVFGSETKGTFSNEIAHDTVPEKTSIPML